MKHIKRNITLGIILLTAFVYISCQKADNQKPWGISKIYIPQAAAKDGGNTINYPVPMNNGINNYLYDTVKNTIDITLGVYRSGLEDLNSYSVTVAADIDTTNQIIAAGTIAQAVLLPSDVYTLPTTASVLNGERESTFHLIIDRAKLIANYGNYYAKKLLLTVRISNPSRYVLNKSLSKIVIVIDAPTFMPKVNLLKGGDMEVASAQYWTISDATGQVWGYNTDKPTGGSGGCLSWFNATTPVNVSCRISQAVNLVVGNKYQLSANVKILEGCTNFSFIFRVSDIAPGASSWDVNNSFIGASLWSSTLVSSLMNGDIRTVGNVGQGMYGNGRAAGTNGVFTATSSVMYITINPYLLNGSFNGSVLVDDVMLINYE